MHKRQIFRVIYSKIDLYQEEYSFDKAIRRCGFQTKKTGKMVVFGVSPVQYVEKTGFKIFCTALNRGKVVHSCCDCYLKMDSNPFVFKDLSYIFLLKCK